MPNDNWGHRIKAFSLRMESEVRKELEYKAKLNGRTLTSEINQRLATSLRQDDTSTASRSRDVARMRRIETKLDELLELNREPKVDEVEENIGEENEPT